MLETLTRVFRGVTCQQDVDARVGDFVAALHALGCDVEKRGKAIYAPEAASVPVRLLNWYFKMV